MSDQPAPIKCQPSTEGCGKCPVCRFGAVFLELERDESVEAEAIMAAVAMLFGFAVSRWPIREHQGAAWTQGIRAAHAALLQSSAQRSAANDLYRRLYAGEAIMAPGGSA